MKLRTALLSDIQAIATLHAASWRFAYRGALSDEYLAGDIIADRTALWEARLKTPSPNQYVVIAYDAETILGFACAYADEDPQWGTLLDNIHVSRHVQRKRVGSKLLNAVAHHCAMLSGNAGLYLWVLQNNTAAQKFYFSHGAENVGTDVWNAPGGTQVPRFRFAWSRSQLPLA